MITEQEIKDQLNGCEVDSLIYEGVVGIDNGKAFVNGEEIEEPIDWHTLWEEYLEGEGIY